MSEKTFCHNHPNAKAIAVCHSCANTLCGMCGNFVDEVVLCERCVENYESEKFVSSQSAKLERPDSSLLIEEPDTRGQLASSGNSGGSKIVQGILLAVALSIIAFQLYRFSNPAAIQRDPNIVAREQAIGTLVECMLVFREIGLVLQDGRMPDNSMICTDSDAANLVSNQDGTIRISHPNPQVYGYREISVSNANPDPLLVRIQRQE